MEQQKEITPKKPSNLKFYFNCFYYLIIVFLWIISLFIITTNVAYVYSSVFYQTLFIITFISLFVIAFTHTIVLQKNKCEEFFNQKKIIIHIRGIMFWIIASANFFAILVAFQVFKDNYQIYQVFVVFDFIQLTFLTFFLYFILLDCAKYTISYLKNNK
ncbi:MAG: hypothetical protein LBH55_00795 [Mycoplasmataceae bacterium]|jgi:hypothetical protein|nr:hypothetical protein [Mycoplasmataceae bacterium]